MIHERTVSRKNAKNEVEQIMRHWTDGSKHLILHFLEPLDLHPIAECIGTDSELKQWVRDYPHKYGAIYVVSEGDMVYDMDQLRPGLEFFHIAVTDEI